MNASDTQILCQRTGEILDRIKLVFARKGFEGASMQELAQAAQMSVGNFYRYFPSKDAIITALVERDLKKIRNEFAAAGQAEDKVAAYLALAGGHMTCTTADEAALWAEIDAAAYRNPEIAAIRERLDSTVRENIMAAMRSTEYPDDPRSEHDLRKSAELVMLLVKGLAKRRGFAEVCGDTRQCDEVAEYAMQVISELIFPGRR